MRRIRYRRLIAVLTALLLLSGLPVAATPIVEVNDAGVRILTVPGTGTFSANGGVATEINNDNWIVVEEAQWYDFDASPPVNRTGGLLWKGSGVVEPFAYSFMAANLTSKFDVTDMNDSGEIVGNLRLSGASTDRMFHWSETDGFSYISSPPYIDPVVPLREVHGIDDDGTVTGWYRPDTSVDPCGDNFLICGFVGQPDSLSVIADDTFSPTTIRNGLVAGNGKTWTSGGGLVDMPDPGVARAVNSSGAIAGTVNSGGNNIAAYWSSPGATATVIGTLPGDSHSYAWGLNEAGWVVGWSGTSATPTDSGQAFLWRPGIGIQPLGFLPGGSESAAYDVNDNGLIVGQSDGRAVIWDMTGTFDVTYPDPLVVDPIADITVNAGDTVEATATATAAGLPQIMGLYSGEPGSLSPAPEGMEITSSGDITWVTDESDVGTHTISVEILDLNELTRPAGFVTFTIDVLGDTPPLVLSIDETIAVVDTALLAGFPLVLEVVESIAVSDDVTVTPPLSIVVLEGVTVGDEATVVPPLVLSIDESVTVADEPAVTPALVLNVNESLVVSDTPTVTPPLLLDIIETVGIDDVVAVSPDSMGSVSGTVWFDTDGDGVFDTGEPPMAGITVYLDLNDDGTRDPGEPFTPSGGDGSYSFNPVVPGDWVVRQEIPVGYDQTFPDLDGPHRISVAAGEAVTDADFGNTQVPDLPPAIDPIDDQFVIAGQQLVVTPTAVDPEGLPLDHSWGGDIPFNAVINGIFVFEPNAGQAPGVYEITYTAYEAGNPGSSSTETFRVFVTAPDAPAAGPVVVTPTPPSSPGPVTIEGEGFEPGTKVGVHVFSEPVFLGSAIVDAEGSFMLDASLPDLNPGNHRIVAIGVAPGGSVRVLDYELDVASGGDGDGDGLTDHEELLTGTDPGVADTDSDGLVDGLDADWLRSAIAGMDRRDFTSWWLGRLRLTLTVGAIEVAVELGHRDLALTMLDALHNRVDTCGRWMDRGDWIRDCDSQAAFVELLTLYRRNVQEMDLPSSWGVRWYRAS